MSANKAIEYHRGEWVKEYDWRFDTLDKGAS